MDSLLEYTIPTNPFIELMKASAMVFAFVVLILLIRIAVTRKDVILDEFTRLSFIAFVFFSIMIILQEIEEIGQPLLLWRLPLLLACSASMFVAIQRRL